MLVIVKGRPIEIDWYIFKGANKQAEDFSQLDAGSIKVFLVGPSNKGDDQISRFNRFTYEVNVATDDNNKQYLKIDIDDTASALLDTGIYDIKVVWVKNSELHLGIREGNQHLSESRLSGIFAITADSSEDNTRLDSGVTAKKILRSFVEPTGYDGLSAYEIAVMHGYTEDEQTWAEEFTEAEDRTDYEMDETKAGDGSTTRDDEKHVPVEEWVHESWAHKVEVTWQNNETTRQSQESTRQSNETTRKNNEGIGATDAECAAGSRRKNESIRVSNESTRQSQEGTRQDNETTRGQKETARQKAEGQLGTTDPDYATSRVKKELDRQSAESTRISNEEGRVAAEGSVEGQTGRAYAESVRVSNESTRQSNEGLRGSAETARQKAEGQLGNTDPDYATSRIKQELDRQSAEAARELAETARENAKISSTTIEYAVGDSGTTPPSSGWQSSIPSYTTGDFLWGRTTMTFGDGTSKVLYAIGSVPDVAVSQNASTGKTTITVGSDSYDVATEPVSVSQNTETGEKELKIGNEILLPIEKEPKADSKNPISNSGVVKYIFDISKPINEILSSIERIKDEENLDCIDIVTNTGTLVLRIKDNEILVYNKLLVQDVDVLQQVMKKLGTKAAFDIFQKKIKGLSEQSDNTQESCIELQDNDGNKYSNVSIDSQYNAEDDAVEFRRSDNDELVAKIDKEGVKAKSFLPLNPQSKSLVIVDKNGNGDYTTISTALAGTSNWDTILVMPGIYEEHVEMYNKPRHLIGVSKESVQVITHDGLRSNNPCNANVGSIENMTFIARIDQIPEGYWDLPSINRSTYGIHIDTRYVEGGQISTNRHTLIVKNVDCISEVSAGIGIGIRYNQTIKLIDCNFYAISGDNEHPNVQGGFYMHNDDFYPNESGADMYVINCICKGEIKGGKIDSLNNNSLCNVTLINNTFYSSQNGVTDAMNVPTNHKWGNDISQTVICHGNNISGLDY